ncbi:MAG: hypothetical protein ACRDJH_20405 [Thermomicrobiales bacterium]
MAKTTTNATEMWSTFKSLSSDTRDEFIGLMIADPVVREELEDLLDLDIARERSHEPVRPLEDVLAEIEQ